MGALTIRKIDDDVKDALKEMAAKDGRSLEGYVRHILYAVVDIHNEEKPASDLAQEIRKLMIANDVFLDQEELPQRIDLQREVLI